MSLAIRYGNDSAGILSERFQSLGPPDARLLTLRMQEQFVMVTLTSLTSKYGQTGQRRTSSAPLEDAGGCQQILGSHQKPLCARSHRPPLETLAVFTGLRLPCGAFWILLEIGHHFLSKCAVFSILLF